MSKRTRWVVAVALAVVCSLGSPAALRAQEPNKALDLYQQGLTQYRTGDYDEARETFNQVLALDPAMETVLKMRSMAEVATLMEMQRKEGLEEVANRLLDLTSRAARARKRDVQEPERLIADFQSLDMEEYVRASTVLSGHGPFAVPYLMPLLKLPGDNQAQARAIARSIATLSGMHKDTSMPLIEVLQSSDDEKLLTRTAGILGNLRDTRAVPALAAVARNEELLTATRDTARLSITAITGLQLEGMDETTDLYLDLVEDYYSRNNARVGFTYGFRGPVWDWDADDENVTYKLVPNYLYYDVMAVKRSLEALESAPTNVDLKAYVVAGLARQLGNARRVSAQDEAEEEKRQDAGSRVGRLESQLPVVSGLMEASTVGVALENSLQEEDVAGSLIMLELMHQKLTALMPALPDEDTVESLTAALKANNPEVRYQAAILFVDTVPSGKVGPADMVMGVMSGAVRSATQRTALLIMNDLHERNMLATALQNLDVNVVESRVHVPSVRRTLHIHPSVDVVFLSANATPGAVANAVEFIGADYRTSGVKVIVVHDATEPAAEITGYPRIAAAELTIDGVRPMITDVLEGPAPSPLAKEEGVVVLQGARALKSVRAGHTEYELSMTESSLLSSLGAYGPDVSSAVLDNLAEFGSGRALDPLADFITSDVSAELKAQACSTVAAVLRRVEGRPAEDLIEALAQALAEGEQNVQEAAAMALSVAGLEQERVVALATPRAGEVIPAKKPDISAIPAPSARTELLQYAPVNTAAIVHIDVKKLMKTAGEEGLPVTGLPAAFEGAAEVMVFVQEPAGHLAFDTDTAAIVVVPGSTRQKLAEALAGPGVEKVTIGDLEMFKTTAGTESYAVVANDTTFVIGSDEGMAQMVHHNVTTKSGATLPRPLTIAFGDHRRSPVNLAAYFSEDYLERVGDELPAAVDGIRTASMGLDIEDGVKAHVQAQYRTERAAILARGNVQGQIEYAQTRVQRLAEQAEEGMKAALQQGAKVLDKVEVGGIGRGLTVSTTITPEDVQMLMGMLMASVTADVDATVE